MTSAQSRVDRSTATRLILVLSLAGIGVAVMQTQLIPLLPALPTLLNTNVSGASWAMTASLLTAAVTMPVFARLGDLYGPKRMLIGCATLLTVGSMTAGLANSLLPLVVGRGLQGCAVAILPLGISVLRAALPPHQVGVAIGVFSASLGVGGAVAYPLSAEIAENYDWHTVFWLSAGLGLISLLGCSLWVPRIARSAEKKFDPLGTVLMSGALVAVLLFISEGSRWGWTSGRGLALLGGSAVLLILFGSWQLRTSSPLVDLRMTASRPVLLTNLVTFATGFTVVVAAVTLPQLLELPRQTGYGLGQSLVHAALVMAPNGIAVMAAAPIAGFVAARTTPKTTLCLGVAIVTGGHLLAVWLLHTAPQIVLCTATAGIGVGIVLASTPMVINAVVPVSETAAANGTNHLARMCGLVAGSAVAGQVLATMTMTVGRHEVPSLGGIRTALLLAVAGGAVACLCAALIPRGTSEHHEPHGDVVADRRYRRAGVEELVEAERRRPRVRPAHGVEDAADAVQRAPDEQQHHRGHTGVVQDCPGVPDGHPAQQDVQRHPEPARRRGPQHLEHDAGRCTAPHDCQDHVSVVAR